MSCLAVTNQFSQTPYNKRVKRLVYDVSANEIREVRTKVAGMTQKQFAEALGVKKLAVTRLETGTLLPSLRILHKIAARFGVTFEITPEPKHDILITEILNGEG